MIFYCRPKVIKISNESVTLKLPFIRRNRNHVGSMYLGAMAVGADLASGILSFNLLSKSSKKVVPLFKNMKSEFYKRAEGDVHFICNEGNKINSMISKTISESVRVNENIEVMAYVPEKLGDEPVAKFSLTLSLKAY